MFIGELQNLRRKELTEKEGADRVRLPAEPGLELGVPRLLVVELLLQRLEGALEVLPFPQQPRVLARELRAFDKFATSNFGNSIRTPTLDTARSRLYRNRS